MERILGEAALYTAAIVGMWEGLDLGFRGNPWGWLVALGGFICWLIASRLHKKRMGR